VDFFAERGLRQDYERSGFNQLAMVGAHRAVRASQCLHSLLPRTRRHRSSPMDAQIASGGERVTIISGWHRLCRLAIQPETMENHSGRPEIHDALVNGEGRSIRHQRHHQS